MRVFVYARYSSDLQSDRSIDDQIRLCREHATSRGWSIAGVYSDAAISGATLARRGISALLEAASSPGSCDGVLCESLDRISRDIADMAGVHKRLRFHGVKLITVADGEVSPLLSGIK